LKDFLFIFPDSDRKYRLKKDETEEKQQQFENAITTASDDDLIEFLKKSDLDVSDYFYEQLQKGGKKSDMCFHRKKAINKLIYIINKNVSGISTTHNSFILKVIITSINNYLSANQSGVSDFHLMKDIVDRNCDAVEEEINTQVPVPLYLGLVGTMVGILVGIGYLWISGGLSDLLNAGSGSSGADGVEILLGGVALAMFSSILGILFTTFSSMQTKNAKVEVEGNKHTFLSWIQAKLLPNLSNDMAQTLEKMSKNLIKFNDTFSSNTSNLGIVLAQVNESYKMQAELWNVVQKLADKNVFTQNLKLFNALKNSANEIKTLAEYLHNTNDYLTNVRALNEKLDQNEQRTQAIEEMATFFRAEVQQLDLRKDAIIKSIGTIDDILEEKLRKLAEHAGNNMEQFYIALGKQQNALQEKLDETQVVVNELKNLTAIKESISKFEQAMRAQNSKLDSLANAIRTLAAAKIEGTDATVLRKTPMPLKNKIWIGAASVGGLLLLLIIIANWGYIAIFLDDIIGLFRM
jgi:hypothetical protein